MSDLISAAIDAIQKERHEAWEDLKDDTEYRKGYDDGLAESIRILIDDLPSAQPEPQWIPCSERLPENERKEYWVCTDAEYQCQCRWTNVNHFWTDLTTDWHWHWMDVPQYTEVIAWMPLPEPYRKDGE